MLTRRKVSIPKMVRLIVATITNWTYNAETVSIPKMVRLIGRRLLELDEETEVSIPKMVRLIVYHQRMSLNRTTCFNSKDGAIDSTDPVRFCWYCTGFNSKDGAIDS